MDGVNGMFDAVNDLFVEKVWRNRELEAIGDEEVVKELWNASLRMYFGAMKEYESRLKEIGNEAEAVVLDKFGENLVDLDPNDIVDAVKDRLVDWHLALIETVTSYIGARSYIERVEWDDGSVDVEVAGDTVRIGFYDTFWYVVKSFKRSDVKVEVHIGYDGVVELVNGFFEDVKVVGSMPELMSVIVGDKVIEVKSRR